ncbi:hypothetical protein GRJ2_001859500 [Grus japonensis]|uniref:Uncharacterized protein n=1 Tax=Grus japonensis TaxID=30415 RepID=A0ABC9XA67_GRUJA
MLLLVEEDAPRGGCCCKEPVRHFAFPEWKSTLKFNISRKRCAGRLQEKGNFSFRMTGNPFLARPDEEVTATGCNGDEPDECLRVGK